MQNFGLQLLNAVQNIFSSMSKNTCSLKADNQQPSTVIPLPAQVIAYVKLTPTHKIIMAPAAFVCCGKAAFFKVIAKKTQHLRYAQAFVKLPVLPRYYTAKQVGEVAHF